VSFHTSPRLLLWVPTGVFALLTAVIAVAPAIESQRLFPPESDPGSRDEAVQRGRAVYKSQMCTYCHTQQVRRDTRIPPAPDGTWYPLAQDARYGPASRAEDVADDEPPFLGTARLGPDLANAGARIPDEAWHLLHLWDPRGMVPGSVMPAYPWLFRDASEATPEDRRVSVPSRMQRDGVSEVFATRDAQDLVAYLLSLRPARPSR
jgi:cytochrome c oxidase cbb3-type subunit 2